ncbi:MULTISPECIES: 3-isopropylmalate dehydrogenase [Dictyoglomus]|jgi:3-isopropylmalate dehydrogenase|uniref:3-isopropylmalate dehydrogenase n=1 Tax=Dictyoglomus turgidum (strain DSM 6724 / Z-1310) TaxID=515635 RepID=B8E2X2_DICTD|nr:MULTISPECIES: 3-isopropylmalate dehydrogenase [Dictyoglomus]ACK42472.1 3-isopropylmalate dehydrogenase [Dictyoglomus turgidum DSM 6724]HBU32072.1 3-isopropylmalate dehydrogenase [Dictyoglomus sp.]
MRVKIAVLPGDGIGPEVVKQAIKVINVLSKKFHHQVEIKEGIVGGAAIDKFGDPLPEETWKICEESDSILLGAVGGPKWDNLPGDKRPEKALLKLRSGFNLFANLRPISIFDELIFSSPIKEEYLKGVDFIIVRELTGGLYFGKPKETRIENGEEIAIDTMIYRTSEIRRIAHVAFKMAQKRKKKVTSVDKANILECSRLWRKIVEEVAKEYPDVALEHMYVDNCAMQIVRNPKQFDVILTENTFGDILSDEAAVITGSIGMLPSASLGETKKGLYEPIHGSAPDIAGQNVANPIATILSVALMFRYSFDLEEEAKLIEKSVRKVLSLGYFTKDLYANNPYAQKMVTTEEMGDLICSVIEGGA